MEDRPVTMTTLDVCSVSAGQYLVLLIVDMCGDVFFGTDAVSIKLFTQQAEESSDRQQEL